VSSRSRIRFAVLLLACVLGEFGMANIEGSIALAGPSAAKRAESFFGNFRRSKLPAGIVQSNGRIEAEQVAIATKLAGRVTEVLAEEGQIVEAGAVVARLDATEIEAQLRSTEAQVRRAERAKEQAEAAIAQRASELELAQQEFQRATMLHERGFATDQVLDQRRSQLSSAQANHRVATAAFDMATAATDGAEADVARLKSVLADTVLTAPRRGRIEYKLVQSGEVVAAGARVLMLIDLADVYMTIFLPARESGRLSLGDEARLILDPVPEYVVPATVSFVAPEAQFTPKSVETADEREKLMFRVKLKIAPELLKKHEQRVKAGVRGVGFVRTRQDAAWPPRLAVKLPP
jgi:HlyD family secretion protein